MTDEEEMACTCGWKPPQDLHAETENSDASGKLTLLFSCPMCGEKFMLYGDFEDTVCEVEDAPN
jgi:hypothetical protein